MKKFFRRIFVFCLAAIQIFLLCGCAALDEMRHNQAFFDADGNILWNDSIYKKLPACDYFVPQINYGTAVNVTEADVPVLLSDILSLCNYYPSDDRIILEEANYEDTIYYCEASVFEDLCGRMSAPFVPDILCYSYDVYNEDAYELETRYYTLTQEQVDAVAYVLENTNPTVLQEGMYLDCDATVYLEECSEDLLFRKEAVNISRSGNTFYLEQYTDTETLLFTVPTDYAAVFAEIMKADEQNNAYYEEEYMEMFDI